MLDSSSDTSHDEQRPDFPVGKHMPPTALPADEQARLDSLAALLGSTPEKVLPFVLRDGFAETERVARAVLRARSGSTSERNVGHEEAMARLDAMLTRNAASQAA